MAAALSAGAGAAMACGDSCITCVGPRYQQLNELIDTENEKTQRWIREEFEYHRRDFFIGYFFHWHILNAMENMSEELTTDAMLQMKTIGAFFDAEHQMETQRLLQKLAARAHKDYQPSFDMCVLGTATKHMANLAETARTKTETMERADRQRQMHSYPDGATNPFSPAKDMKNRMTEFLGNFCDKNDDDGGLKVLCGDVPAWRINKDVDYTRTISFPLTIHDKAYDTEEWEITALSQNLYGHRIFNTLPADYLKQASNQESILNFHSLIAKRSVATYSYNSIAAMKMQGRKLTNEESSEEKFLAVLLKTLGVTNPDEFDRYLGYRPRGQKDDTPSWMPSYYAIMEVLTKKIYQDPQFYVNLYDTPANVDRKGAAIRGISLMQDMDIFKSQLRNEAALSVLLETHIMELQGDVEDQLGRLRSEGVTH